MAEEKAEKKELKKKPGVLRRVFLVMGMVWLAIITVVYLTIFVEAIVVGYLSVIGIAVGSVFLLILVSSLFVQLFKKEWEKRFSWAYKGVVGVIIVAGATTVLWPEGEDEWRVYRFEDELTRIEGKRIVAEEENAAVFYDRLLSGMDVNDEPAFFFNKEGQVNRDILFEPWKGSEYPEVNEWLDGYAEVINKLQFIGQMEKCRWPVQSDCWGDYAVDFSKVRRCWQVLIATGNRDVEEGRTKDGLGKYFCVLRIAEHLYQQPDVMSFYVGFGVEAAALGAIKAATVKAEISNEDMQLIENRLPLGENNWPRDWAKILEVNKLQYMNMMGKLYEVNSRGNIRFRGPQAAEDKNMEKMSRMKRLNRWYWVMNMPLNPDEVKKMAEKDLADRELIGKAENGRILYGDMKISFWSLQNISKMFSNLHRWITSEFIFNVLDDLSFYRLYLKRIAHQRGAIIVLALRKYRNECGHWPENIEEVQDLTPTGTFADPTNGGRFVYKQEKDGFKLYSTGYNGVDEGGISSGCGAWREPNQPDDMLIWPMELKEKKEDMNE